MSTANASSAARTRRSRKNIEREAREEARRALQESMNRRQ